MKQCPTCGTTFADDLAFCLRDGTALVEASPAADEDDAVLDALVAEARVSPGEERALRAPEAAEAPVPPASPPPAERRCPRCGRTYAASYAFCLQDGAPLVGAGRPAERPQEAPAPRMTAPVPAPASPPSAARGARPSAGKVASPVGGPHRKRMGLWFGLGLLAVALIAGGAYFLSRPPALEGEALAALDAGNIVTPVGSSAYDFYRRLEAEEPGSASLERVAAQALPLLSGEITGFYDRWYATSEAADDDWERIERLTTWAVALDPTPGALRAQHAYARGRIALRQRDYHAAQERFEDAVAAWPEWALPYNSIGVLYARIRNYDEAVRWYSEAAGRDPSWAFPLQNLGASYIELRRYFDAERALERALALDDALPRAHFLLGVAYAQQDRYADAVREGERALQLDPHNTSTGYEGDFRALLGRWRAHLHPANSYD